MTLFTGQAVALDPQLKFFQYEFYHPSEGLDLPTEIADAAEDRLGFLWLATERGLIRFDGITTETFRLADHPGLLSNKPSRLFVDSGNRLFVASERGTSVFDGNTFSPLLDGGRNVSQAHAFAEGAQGQVWIGTDEALARLDGDQLHLAPLGAATPPYTRALLWHAGKLYVGGRGNVSVIDGNGVSQMGLPPPLADAQVRDLESHKGRVWGATRSGLFRIDNDAPVLVRATDEEEPLAIDGLLSDRDENLWFAGRRRFGRFYPDGTVELPNLEDSMGGFVPELSRILEDREGNQWHVSRLFGVLAIGDTPVQRTSYTEGLPSPNVTAITKGQNGSILAATDRGVAAITNQDIVPIINEDMSRDKAVLSMAVDNAARLWLGTESGVRIFDLNRNEWTDVRMSSVIGDAVNTMVADTANGVWIGTDVGLFHNVLDELHHVPGTEGLAVEAFLLDSNGDLWMGTERGVERVVEGEINPNAAAPLEWSSTIVGLTELSNGQIVAAAADHGILLRTSAGWQHYGETDGLPPEQIIDVESIGQYLWIITSGGLYRAEAPDPLESRPDLKVYPIAGSALYRPFVTSNCCRGRNDFAALINNGQLVAATDDGVVTLDGEASFSPIAAPRPYITAIHIGSDTLAPTSESSLELSPEATDIQIDYSAIQPAGAKRVRFRYRLAGLGDDWIEAGTGRSARFLSLPPGNYSFELQASLFSDHWSQDTARIAISRPPAFLETATFRILVWGALVGAGLAAIAQWLQVAKVRHRKLTATIDARTEELKSLNTKLRTVNEALVVATETDPLTGLLNRRFFSKSRRPTTLKERAPREGLIALIDVDFFKRVNDAYGHSAGDEVLREFASTLLSVTRERDLVVRWGGEEFLVLCACPNDDARSLLERICVAVREHAFKVPEGTHVPLTCSIGGARYPLHPGDSIGEQFGNLLEIADSALYAVKMNGRDGWAFLEAATGADDSGADRPIPIDQHLADAGLLVQSLVENGRLTWRASRAEISLTMSDTVTLLGR